jgi:hypothetical protein
VAESVSLSSNLHALFLIFKILEEKILPYVPILKIIKSGRNKKISQFRGHIGFAVFTLGYN